MARAKRIDRDRAEARRRYRAAAAADSTATAEDGSSDEAAAPTAPATSGTAARGAAPRQRAGTQPARPRMGLRQAFLAAYRPVHLREDLAGLPKLVAHWSVWGPVLAAVVSTALPFALGSTNELARFAFSIFVSPGAVAGVFIAGYFAPTAAYLAGLVVSLASSILFSIFAYAVAGGALGGDASGITTDVVGSSIATAFVIGPLYGIFLGATAAWYKRFLAYTAPPRPANRPAAQGGNRRSQGPRAKSR